MDKNDKQNISEFQPTVYQRMISSCCGALLVSLFVTPLDVVKIKLQAQEKDFMTKNKCYLFCNGIMDHLCYCEGHGPHHHHQNCKPLASSRAFYTGTTDAFFKIIRHEGPTSLWSGLSPTLAIAVPNTVIYFTSYDLMMAKLRKRWGDNPWNPALGGISARVVAVTVTSPLELVRTRMQYKKMSYKSVFQALQELVHKEGLRGLWKGIGPSLFRDVPFSAIYWTLLEEFKSLHKGSEPSFRHTFLSGAAAGMVASVLTLPFDVIKTHRQIELGTSLLEKRAPTSMPVLLRSLYQQRGVKALFAGITPRIIKVAPACAIMISVYDYAKARFAEINAARVNET